MRARCLRFKASQLFIGVALISITLFVITESARRKKEEVIRTAYGSREIFEMLRGIQKVEVFRVSQKKSPRFVGDQIDFLQDITITRCQNLSSVSVAQLRYVLSSPQNFIPVIHKSYLFHPVFLLRFTAGAKQLDIYFDFSSNVAAILVGGKLAGGLTTDKVSNDLHGLISSPCERQ